MPARRTSNHLKALRGTDRPHRLREEPEFPPASSTLPPDWVTDPVALAEWEHKVDLLSSAGVLNAACLTVLGHYCNMHAAAVARWNAGDPPLAADLTQLRLMATEFGFTPASRSKAGGGGKKESANPFQKLG